MGEPELSDRPTSAVLRVTQPYENFQGKIELMMCSYGTCGWQMPTMTYKETPRRALSSCTVLLTGAETFSVEL